MEDNVAERLKPIFENKPHTAKTSGYWFDIILALTADALGLDLEIGENQGFALKKIAEDMTLHLKQVGYARGGVNIERSG